MSVRHLGLNALWGQVYVNDRLMSAGEAVVSAFDRGFLYGDGIYETVRAYAGRPFMLDAHIRRMEHGCSVIALPPPDPEQIRTGVHLVLQANGLGDAYVRITVTRGVTGRLWHDMEVGEPTLTIIAKPYARQDAGQGLRLVVSGFRTDERSPLSGIKQTGILPKILAREAAVRAGADDAVLLDTRGYISEATSSNAFWVTEGKLMTPSPDCGILAGVTREIVIRLAREHGVDVVEGSFSPGEMAAASEAFLTSSTWELMPVTWVGDIRVGDGVPGPLTRRLHSLYRLCVSGMEDTRG